MAPRVATSTTPRSPHPLFIPNRMCPDSDVFAERLVDDHEVAVAPGKTFGDVSAGMVRISLASSPETIVGGIERIAAARRKSVV